MKTQKVEDEIDLVELFHILKKRQLIIWIGTVIFVSIAFIYIKTMKPIYKGSVMIEIGTIMTKKGIDNIDNIYTLKSIIDREMNISVSIPKNSNLLLLSYSNNDKNHIREELDKAIKFILARHQNIYKSYNNLYMQGIKTKVIGKVQIEYKTKKRLIIAIAFITGLMLSIFLVFVLEFIQNFKKEEEDS